MAKSTVVSRKDMKDPDKFQVAATQAAAWLAGRKRLVLAAAAGAIAILLLAALLSLVQARREESARRASAALFTTVAGEVSPVPLPGLPGPFFPTEEARQRAILTEAERVIAEFPNTDTGTVAWLAKADAHYRLQEWDAARDAYDRFLRTAARDHSLRFGALEGLALTAEGRGDLEAAASAWEQMAKEAKPHADRADLARARVLAASGKTDQAREILAAFQDSHPDSLLVPEAAQRLARLGAK